MKRSTDGILARPETGCVQVAARWWHRTMPVDLGDTACSAVACGTPTNVDLQYNVVRAGVNYRF